MTNNSQDAALKIFRANRFTSRYLSLTSHHLAPINSRSLKKTGEDGFFGETVQTPRTIPHAITLRRHEELLPEILPASPQEAGYEGAFPPPGKGKELAKAREMAKNMRDEEVDIFALIALGSPGVDGHPNTLHGGIACMLMDEMMSIAIGVHIEKAVAAAAAAANTLKEDKQKQRDMLHTVQLDVRYRAPIRTSDVVVLKAWAIAMQRRKIFVRATINQEQNNEEVVCAEGYAVFMRTKSKGANL
ncbi:hypothetical protein KEM54_002593 [Ascosphaera aggregata]|nr:hypothetical protein KEM54_002593 [Ascosphaera aggregata]